MSNFKIKRISFSFVFFYEISKIVFIFYFPETHNPTHVRFSMCIDLNELLWMKEGGSVPSNKTNELKNQNEMQSFPTSYTHQTNHTEIYF